MLRTTILFLSFLTLSLAAPTKWYEKYSLVTNRVIVPHSYYEILKTRISIPANPKAVRDVVCLDRRAHIVSHDELAAELSICSGQIAQGKCRENGKESVGRVGTAMFTVRSMGSSDSKINLTKQRWEGCVAAARGQCPTGSLSGICVGGGIEGDVGFTLVAMR
ncbi:hypothetical protein QBC38DRAFT_27927 [Podospora fimiseda]|uniref:Ecp2 effector protein domain-containing protein n=1 Tax=Podospora fimiseda TaxID=252190 RepID=A0AAN7BVM1_9PEZI|nr:hypothetical protein QBC38DRAFT_27927 [Podospora fimiseda]